MASLATCGKMTKILGLYGNTRTQRILGDPEVVSRDGTKKPRAKPRMSNLTSRLIARCKPTPFKGNGMTLLSSERKVNEQKSKNI